MIDPEALARHRTITRNDAIGGVWWRFWAAMVLLSLASCTRETILEIKDGTPGKTRADYMFVVDDEYGVCLTKEEILSCAGLLNYVYLTDGET